MIIQRVTTKFVTEEKDIRDLSTDELGNYTSIGTVSGENFFHCFCLAGTIENFFERVCGYTVKPADPPYKITIAFYEKKTA